ncbi:MAG: protein kinase domain-containing protein [Thermomicrobiales bacterium]
MTDSVTTSSTANTVTIGGRYEVYLDRPLGSGGLAMVYRGHDLRARRDVAVKTLREEFQSDPESRRRFRQEARMMAFVSHPGLVTIYDLVEHGNESWIVMEVASGRNLKQLVEHNGALLPGEVIRILEPVAGALEHMHERKIVHLDVKPQNLILTDNGSIKLIDFGLAQSVAPRQDTVGGSAFGTAAYLSPEQASGSAVDRRTDVYALGCVVYELFTGRPPFEAPDGPEQKRQLIADHLDVDPTPPSQVRPDRTLPHWVDDVTMRALEKEPRHRFATAVDFAKAARHGLERDAATTQALPTDFRVGNGRRRLRVPAQRAFQPDSIADDDFTESAPSPARRAWNLGGRVAKRTRPVQRTIWRLALIFAMGNLLLGSVILVRQGPEALVERFLAVVPGATTEVVIDGLNLRAGPGAEFAVLTVLSTSESVEVAGLSESNEQGRWWPVTIEQSGVRYEGWVWSEGLQPNEWTGRLSFMQELVEGGQDVRDGIGDGVETIADLWPL